MHRAGWFGTLTLASIVLVISACAQIDDGADIDEVQQDLGWPSNGLTPDDLVLCSLLANTSNNHALATRSLNEAVTLPSIRSATSDPRCEGVWRKLIAVALAKNDYLAVTDASNLVHVYYGSMGLCPAWKSSVMSTACQESVSGAMAALINAFGYQIPLSLLGPSPSGRIPAGLPTLPPNDQPTPGYTIYSYQPCSGYASGLDRNCGWLPPASQGVGTCTPGTQVTVSAAGRFNGTSTGDMMLRICDGQAGCNKYQGSPTFIADNDDAHLSPNYLAPEVTFTCRGVTGGRGSYTVMIAPYVAGYSGSASPGASAGVYPAPEIGATSGGVYPWAEGTFFGNLFAEGGVLVNSSYDPATGSRSVTYSSEGVSYVWVGGDPTHLGFLVGYLRPFKYLYSSTAPTWQYQQAYDKGRVCANSDELYQKTGLQNACATFYAGTSNGAFANGTSGPVCSSYNWTEQTYESCRASSTGPTWSYAISTHLDDPCRLVGGTTCATLGM